MKKNAIATASLADYAAVINDEHRAANDEEISLPQWSDEDVRAAHRQGYEQAISEFRQLARLGYSRASEIANIMQRHADTAMGEWVQKFDEWIEEWPVSKSVSYEPLLDMPASWHVVRQRIIARDGGKCVVCESSHRLEVDHIVEVRMGGCPDDDNLRTLCAKCHAERRRV